MMKFKHPKNLHCILRDNVFDEGYKIAVTQSNMQLRGMVMNNLRDPIIFYTWDVRVNIMMGVVELRRSVML